MGRYFAQVNLLSATGNTEDTQINGFACGTIPDLTSTYATNWNIAISAFYEAVRAAGGLRGMAQGPHLIKFYDIEGSAPNYPIFERTFNLASAPGAIELPQEVALCISYSNEAAVTVPRARRRGRIYISGWSEAVNDAGRPTTTLTNALRTAFGNYVVAFNGYGDLSAGIWSRTNGQVYPIETAWVDNEWDTMRSRGGKSTARSTWTLP